MSSQPIFTSVVRHDGFAWDSRVSLGDKVFASYTGILAQDVGTTIEIGDLSGTTKSGLLGGPTVGRALTYRIGGGGGNVLFGGPISEQAAGNITAMVKRGVGIWTLGGFCSYAGFTTVEAGTLKILGSINNNAPSQVLGGATLQLAGGMV